MKIALESRDKPINGYININNNAYNYQDVPENTSILPGRFNNLDPIISDKSVDEIVFCQPLNIIHPNDMEIILKHWIGKLKPDGEILIHFIDIDRLSILIYNGSISFEDAHLLIFGRGYENRSIMNFDKTKRLIQYLGLEIKESVTHTITSMRVVQK